MASRMAWHLAPAAVRIAAVSTGKIARFWSRALGRGESTTLPGYLAGRIDHVLVPGLARGIPNGTVLVTGTNGKTTTTRILAGTLHRAGLEVITDPEGSNPLMGIATALLIQTNWWGRLAASWRQADIASVVKFPVCRTGSWSSAPGTVARGRPQGRPECRPGAYTGATGRPSATLMPVGTSARRRPPGRAKPQVLGDADVYSPLCKPIQPRPRCAFNRTGCSDQRQHDPPLPRRLSR